jgi:hypothetical protein
VPLASSCGMQRRGGEEAIKEIERNERMNILLILTSE